MNRDVGHGTTGENRDEQQPDPSELPIGEVYDLLSEPRRRRACALLRAEPEWTLQGMATTLAARERGCVAADVPAEHRKRVTVSLYHVHLPKLTATGVARFDEAAGRIIRGHSTGQVFKLLGTATRESTD